MKFAPKIQIKAIISKTLMTFEGNILLFLIVTIFFFTIPNKSYAINLASRSDLENISNLQNVKIDFRYATANNFLNKPVYGDFKQCFLHKIAAEKFKKASQLLHENHPQWKFILFDCLRPHSIQKIMWNLVNNTPSQKYVANPDLGSLHNYGFAIDLSLIDENGEEIDMGTPFDFFGIKAEPQKEQQLLQEGKLTKEQVANRKILRSIMLESGFNEIPNEWWHFNALSLAVVKKEYEIVQ